MKVSITMTHKKGLVVSMRSMSGKPYDGNTLAEALEQAAILCEATPEVAVVDCGYKGVDVEGVKIYHPGPWRNRTIARLPGNYIYNINQYVASVVNVIPQD